MTKQQVSRTDYKKLVGQIQREMKTGLRELERLWERQKITTCWTIGRHIHRYLADHGVIRGATGAFYERLSGDLKVNSRTLQHYEQFFRYFPKLTIDEGMTWSHYRFLLSEPDEKKRQRWIKRVLREHLSSTDLRLMVASPTGSGEKSEGVLRKEPRRGKLYVYRLVSGAGLMESGTPWFVDCGFANRIEAPHGDGVLEAKRLVESVKIEQGYRLKIAGDARVDDLFTFKARLVRVIDADTLLAHVDEGFGIWTEQRLRLSAIDAAELNTLDGQRARQRVIHELEGLPFIIVKTYKSDKYDRYLADVFYLPGESDPHKVAASGVWLNGRLLEKGWARRV
ncbi:MAG TPA: hypothetical protein DD723_05575 [Candidatus Omnitrophica bacterium]|nr:MAG: hypothetical protein A2Z81_05475 [Omnitrophica WOR_2 bacterium GWA2_45_18]HBR14996.1 hypothetical protein [Candidatus Omnitrophota bacterium]